MYTIYAKIEDSNVGTYYSIDLIKEDKSYYPHTLCNNNNWM